MEKTIKLRSQFLPLLNESLCKLSLADKVTKVSPVIVEADGKFSSIVKAADTFNPANLDSNIEAEEENEETKETKQQLLNKATDSLKQTIQNSKELDEILTKIKKLSQEDGYNEWRVNDKGNTASLKSKNAYIFKQNDNLCLSHNGKVELFKSVSELRKWLQDNNYPLPKDNIEIHESVIEEDKKKDNFSSEDEIDDWNWFDLVDQEKDTTIEPDQENNYENVLNQTRDELDKIQAEYDIAQEPYNKYNDAIEQLQNFIANNLFGWEIPCYTLKDFENKFKQNNQKYESDRKKQAIAEKIFNLDHFKYAKQVQNDFTGYLDRMFKFAHLVNSVRATKDGKASDNSDAGNGNVAGIGSSSVNRGLWEIEQEKNFISDQINSNGVLTKKQLFDKIAQEEEQNIIKKIAIDYIDPKALETLLEKINKISEVKIAEPAFIDIENINENGIKEKIPTLDSEIRDVEITDEDKAEYINKFNEYKNLYNTLKPYLNKPADNSKLKNKLDALTAKYRELQDKNKPAPSREELSLGKAVSKQDYQYFNRVKKPVKLQSIDLEDSIEECFAGTATANLGSAVTYLGNRSSKRKKKKAEKENLEENYFIDGVKSKGNNENTEADKIYSVFRNDKNYRKFLGGYIDADKSYKNLRDPAGLQRALDHIDTDKFKTHMALRRQDTKLPDLIKQFFKVRATEFLKNNGHNETNEVLINSLVAQDIKSFDGKDLNELENYLKATVPHKKDWKTHLVSSNLFKQDENDPSKLKIDDTSKNGNKAFFNEWKLAYLGWDNPNNKKDYVKEYDTVKQRMHDFINGNITTLAQLNAINNKPNQEPEQNIYNFSPEELKILRDHNFDPNDKNEEQLRKVIALFKESVTNDKLYVIESAIKHPWLNKLMGQRLVEDDTPADFATGSPISSDTGEADTGTTDTTSTAGAATDSPDLPDDVQGMDFAGEAEQNGFGDVDISVGGGNYGPDEGEQQAPMPQMPDYQIKDVLLNDDNPNDIKVKVQNMDTKETEIKNLDEIDV